MGMLDPAYFVGRVALLNWLNDLLALSYAKVEECANGAAYCQIIHSLHPTVVALHRVDYTTKAQYAMVANYKVLQAAFTKLSIDRHIDVEKLIRGKYQDNLEFLQWLKGYYSTHGPDGPPPGYDPVAARARAAASTPRSSGRPAAGRPLGGRPLGGPRGGAAAAAGRPAGGGSGGAPPPRPRGAGITPKPPVPRRAAGAAATAGVASMVGLRGELAAAKAAAAAATEKANGLEVAVRELAADRDFYFGKLRAVEELLKGLPEGGGAGEAALAASVLDILYATDDAAAPGEEGAEGVAEGDAEGEAGGGEAVGEEPDPYGDEPAGVPVGGAGGAGEVLEEEEFDERGELGDGPDEAAARSPSAELFSADVADEELLTAS